MTLPLPVVDGTVDAAPEFDIADHLDGITAFLGGTANVIMQLSHAPVAYGVMESTVESGAVTKHPIKRTRTTLTYIAVALLGSDDERAAYRDAVNVSHRPVRSGPDSPVRYNAFDRKLQLWVGACIYRGIVDTIVALHGELDEPTHDALYASCARLATTLQVPPEMWPADRAAFQRYWDAGLAEVAIDDRARRYLHNLMRATFFPLPLRATIGPLQQFFVTGFLPQQFRDEMRLPWTAADQRRFDRLMSGIGAVARRMPGPVRRFPFNFYLTDMRIRRRLGRRLV